VFLNFAVRRERHFFRDGSKFARETSEVRMKIMRWMTSVRMAGVLTAGLLAGCLPAAMAQLPGHGPTESDMYCSGFVTKDAVPTNSAIFAGWDAPNQAVFSAHDYVYLKGGSYQVGQKYQILRRTRDFSGYEMTKDQVKTLAKVGMEYAELGRVKVIDVQKNVGIAQVELSCDAFDVGDLAIPWQDRPTVAFKTYPPINRFVQPNGKTAGHIVMGSEYAGIMGTKDKVYLDVGSNQGLKPGDYFRATRTYEASLKDESDKLGAKAAVPDNGTYREKRLVEPMVSSTAGLKAVADLPRRTLGEMVILHTTPVSATAMITSVLEQIQVGDAVEMMEEPPPPPPPPPTAAPMPPTITCSADPASVTVGDNATIRCNGNSPDGHPLTYTFVADQGSVAPRENVATLSTAGTNPGNITVMATVKDDRDLSASANTVVSVQAPAAPPQASQAGDFVFQPNSARVDNKAKAILDGIALRLNREANSTALVVGYTAVEEKSTLGPARANNAKAYLTKEKGIDAARITTADGGKGGRRVEIWFVPAGATVPAVTPVAAPAAAPAKPAAKKPASTTAKKPATTSAPKK
jgi:outer membrane protein OmpA-like peptidoglycan-associated protein